MDAAAARAPDEASETGREAVADDATAARVVSFREKSTYRSDPEYSASGIRQYVNDQLYPHLLAAMQAINTTRPLHPVLFMARCLLEGSAPEDEPTAAPQAADGGVSPSLPLLSDQVQGPLQDAITACVKENPRPPDPVQFVGNYLKGMCE